MSQPVGPFWKVRDLIAVFLQMGCELRRTIRTQARTPVGLEIGDVRYLFNPENGRFLQVDDDLDDEDRVPPSVVENWERRLGIEIPKPKNTH
jgi:hypothetical protein